MQNFYEVKDDKVLRKVRGKKIDRPEIKTQEGVTRRFKMFYGCVIDRKDLKHLIDYLVGSDLVVKSNGTYFIKSPLEINGKQHIFTKWNEDMYASFIPVVANREYIEMKNLFHLILGEEEFIYVGMIDQKMTFSCKPFHYSPNLYDDLLYPATQVDYSNEFWEQFKAVDAILNHIFDKTLFQNFDYYNFDFKKQLPLELEFYFNKV